TGSAYFTIFGSLLQDFPNAPAPSDDASPTNDFETNPELLQYLGARPSAYQVIRSTLDVDKTQHFDYRNCVPQLKALFGQPAGSGTALLRQIPVQHPCHALAQTTATLVDSLVNHLLANPQLLAQETGGSKPTQRFNPNILADALNTLSAMTQAMPSLTHDSISFADCYRAIAEELMVIMTLCKPYTHKDFKQATEQQMKERLGPEYLAKMPNVPPTFLFSSGMQALSVGLEMAEQRDANQPFTLASDRAGNVETPTYFEVAELLKKTGNHYVADATTYATLNHSTPLQDGHGWGVENLVASLKTQLQQRAGATTPLTLILDSTLEKRGDLSKIATTFASDIASDKLRILLCKSYQKYSNLGLTKTQSGSVALLAANTQDNNKLQAALGSQEQQLGWANNDDSQLLIHLLKHSTGEFNLLEKAAQNAQFVRDELFNGKDGLSPVKAWQPGLPFIVLDCATDKSHQFTMGGSADATVYSHSQGELLSTMDVRARSSFAYLESTQSSYKPDEETGNIMRLTFGMESKAELVERFYMASRLMASSEKSWCCKDASQEIEKILRDSGVFTSPEEMASLSLTQKIAKVASQQRPALATGDSVLQKRLSAQTKNQGGAFVLNKLASVVNQLNWLVDNASYSAQAKLGDNDMKLLGDLLDAFLKNDLPGVSPRAREGILQLNQFLALETIKRGGEQNINQGIQRILNMADKTTSGMLLRITNLSRIPDAVFQQQTPHTRRQLIDKLFLPMDSQTRVLFIQNRLNAGDVHIAQACLHTLKTLLEKGKLQSPDTFLNHEGTVPTAPSLMAEGKHLMMQERVRQQLASLEKLKAEQ
ncbi:hypothetical protein ACW9H6_22400, partial [Pseudomonas sp. SDO528_S397]